jgi:YNFM family putative membrane transporter
MIVGSLMTCSSLFGIIIGIAFITTGFFITTHLVVLWVLKANKLKHMLVRFTCCFYIWVQVLSARRAVGSGYTVAGVRLSV